jgi:predicted exporter
MDTLKIYALLGITTAALCVIGPWLDGQPSDAEEARDTQAAVHDALAAARRQQHQQQAQAALEYEQRANTQVAALGARRP